MLSFNNNREFLNVPWMAITGFADPSVQFGLQFKTIEESEDGGLASSGMSVEFDEASGQDDNASYMSQSEDDEAPVSADVVELDHFRKK